MSARWVYSALVGVLALFGPEALAQDDSGIPTESERTGAFEFKVGSYRPRLADDPAYQQVVGSGNMLLVELEIDRQFFQEVGSFGVGVSFGYAERYGYSVAAATGVATSERTSVRVLPIKALAVYRFDYAALNWGIPLVPFAKAGLALQPWWMHKGGEVETVDGARGSGAKYGYALTAGISLLLDFLEPRMAKDFDGSMGVNHSYLFGEYNMVQLNSFGRPGFDFSSGHWMFGLMLEY